MAKKNIETTVEEIVETVVEPTNEELIEKFETEVENEVEIEVVVEVDESKVELPIVVNNTDLQNKNVELYKVIKTTHFGKKQDESIDEYVERVYSAIILNSIEYNENLDKLGSTEDRIKIKNYSFVFDEYLESIKQGFSNPNYCIEMETAIGKLKQKI